jgi:putative transposase
MRRACKVTLKYITARKQRQVNALIQSYRSAVNFYIKSFWDVRGKLDKETLARLRDSRLSERYKQAALKQAFDIVIATKKSAKVLGKHCEVPIFNGKIILDQRHIATEDGNGSFDLVLKLAALAKGHRITLPTKHTAMTRKWLSVPNAKFIQGCALSETGITLWVSIPEQPLKQEGRVLGIDLGVNKLISDSDGNHYGRDFKAIRDKIRRKKPCSKAKHRALKERENYICRIVNQLPWQDLKVIGFEDLIGIKTGKQKNRGKDFRKAMAPWIVRRVAGRIECKAQENRVRPVKNNPANTSRTCPQCSLVSKENRKGEKFQCVSCGYKGDADTVGALNILAKTLVTLGSLQSPRQKQKKVA